MKPIAPRRRRRCRLQGLALAGWAACAAAPASALELAPAGLMVQAGASHERARALSVGLVWPWSLRRPWWGGELTGATEAYVSYWHADSFAGGAEGYSQANLVPMLRLRFAQGRSAWFAEAGIGVSYTDSLYRTPGKQFSTRFNFTDVAGIGRSFGPQRRQELSLRITHYSNANLRKPNPGINFVQLRYAVAL